MTAFDPEAAAAEMHALWNTGRQRPPFTDTWPDLPITEAYKATHALRLRREASGERVVGRKLSFTNRTIWERYGVDAPGWGYVYDTTISSLADHAGGALDLTGTAEPRIEPEIQFGIARTPEPGMDERALLSCIGWIAHGFEIVQSVFPNWKLRVADTAIAYGLHARLVVGPHVALDDDRDALIEKLRTFRLTLYRNGERVDEGSGAFVLDSPLLALKNFCDGLGASETHPLLMPGEVVTTGTITDAYPAIAGDTWTTELDGLPLPGARLSFR